VALRAGRCARVFLAREPAVELLDQTCLTQPTLSQQHQELSPARLGLAPRGLKPGQFGFSGNKEMPPTNVVHGPVLQTGRCPHIEQGLDEDWILIVPSRSER